MASAAAIQANTTCELGNCAVPGTLSSGGTTSGTENFNFTFGNGDQYHVTTGYSATDTPITFNFSANAVYTGNNGNTKAPSVGGDTLTVDFLEDFAYTGTSASMGASSAVLTEEGNAPGSYSEANVYYDNMGIGVMGPYYGPGMALFTAGPTVVNGLGNPIDGDFRYILYFAPGTSPVPEPATASMFLLATLALVFVFARYRTKRKEGFSRVGGN